jgi:dienelactone hydrolase
MRAVTALAPTEYDNVPPERRLDIVRTPPSYSPLAAPGNRVKDWTVARREILSRWQPIVGARQRAVEPLIRWLDDRQANGVRRRTLRYGTAGGDTVPAILLEPTDMAQPRPGVLALHQTTAVGKSEPAGEAGDPNLAFGLEMSRRGYAVLIPDVFVAGERTSEPFRSSRFQVNHPEWSATGKMLHDHMQGVTVLSRLPSVDAGRIAAIGHSLGGYNAWILLGADPRVRVAVASCGYASLAGDPDPYQWCRAKFPYVARLKPWLDQRVAPFEWNEIVALAAPKPLFIWFAKRDAEFPHWDACLTSLRTVERLYAGLRGHGAAFEVHSGDVEHSFPEHVRRAAYDFIDKWLRAT